MVINALRVEGDSLAFFGHLLELVQPTIEAFHSISFSHTYRYDNFVAHNLAKHVKHVRGLKMWA